jgi:hypothetical protein
MIRRRPVTFIVMRRLRRVEPRPENPAGMPQRHFTGGFPFENCG